MYAENIQRRNNMRLHFLTIAYQSINNISFDRKIATTGSMNHIL